MPAKYLFYITFLLVMCGCNASQSNMRSQVRGPGDMPPNSKPGSCYAKCMIGDQYDTVEEEFAIFTGDTSSVGVEVESRNLTLILGGNEYVKKRSEVNCTSEKDEDCWSWVMVEEDQVTRRVLILKDTSRSNEYTIETIKHQVLTEESGFTEWREVVCSGNVSRDLVAKVQQALYDRGYYNGAIENNLGVQTKAALIRYQQDTHLPLGQLDFETLAHLDIKVR